MRLSALSLDLRSALARTQSELYTNLVTRTTGRAVRGELELLLSPSDDVRLAVLDFSDVGVLDFSCADEIVAQLLLRFGAGVPAQRAIESPSWYFMFRGLDDAHREALEPVLERHGLALIAEAADGSLELLGTVDAAEQMAWRLVMASGGGDVQAIAAHATEQCVDLAAQLQTLARRRLLLETAAGFHPLRHH
jgi:hypothetical protein